MTTQIHLLYHQLGRLPDFVVTAEQVADCTQAIPLLGKRKAEAVLADKGYDAEAIVQLIEAVGATAVIPPRAKRQAPRPYNQTLYQQRNRISSDRFRQIETRSAAPLCLRHRSAGSGALETGK